MNFTRMTSAMFKAMELPFIMAAALMDTLANRTNAQVGATTNHLPSRGGSNQSHRFRERANAKPRRMTRQSPVHFPHVAS
jgi:hypothetical protein